ncbi:MAG: DNA repair protein RecN [Sorangiineae bacterium]|nr:DNA repair protein RecN [Polyangiaceae bacterium]MEB2322567.1 DNA repair protein RecN [Sorangiineae bacterium]
MLSYLRVRGLALLDDVSLELAPGMNVLTGETGAGKSIIVDALTLLRGARGRADLVRSGEEAATVDAQFELPAPLAARASEILCAHGLPRSDANALVVQRVVPASGRGRSLVQAELTTQGVLGELGELLIDICSQHEHHSLVNVARHLELLDGYAHLDQQVGEYGREYREYREARAAIEALGARAAEGGSRADYLRFQIDEIDRVAPEPGEHTTLRQRVALLGDARRWVEFARDAQDQLYEAEDSVAMRIAGLLERARRGAEESPRLCAVVEELSAAQAAVEQAAQLAARFGDELELDPAELERAEERLHELESLRRKHGVEPDALLSRRDAMREELDALEHVEERLGALEQQALELRRRCVARALELRAAREAAAHGLARALEAELAALHIASARLAARVEPAEDDEPGPRGLDRVELLFSANPGEPLAPLSRVASGGELSRVLLALKNVLGGGDRVATYVFDEVDAGVGGAVAEAIGLRLRHAAANHQVLCITHLPQIAAFADAHFRVMKHTEAGRTVTRVLRLSDDERAEELARMLGGAKITDSAREHARQLRVAALEATRANADAPRPRRPARGGRAKSAR